MPSGKDRPHPRLAVLPRGYNLPDKDFPGLSQALVAGDWILLSGQLALDGGNLVGPGDPETQVRQCFANIEAALALAGASLGDIVKLTCFLQDPAAFPAYSRYKEALFADRVAPAGTAVLVAGLLVPGALLEVEALAYKPSRGGTGGKGEKE